MGNNSEIFRGVVEAASNQLSLDYDKSKSFAHRGIKGDEREAALASFLRERLPPAFGIGTGEAIDHQDRRTGQLDLMIFDQTVAKPVLKGSKNDIYPCESLYAVVEVKSVFSRVEAVTCLEAAHRIRKLKPFGQQFVDSRTMGAPADEKSHRCMYLVFAWASDLKEEGWLDSEYNRLLQMSYDNKIPASSIDRLFVLDRGMINPAKAQGKESHGDSVSLFVEFFIHLVEFLERERRRRPALSWRKYALSRSTGWRSLAKS